MRAFVRLLGAYVEWLSKILLLKSDALSKDRLGNEKRGNAPPPSGGPGSF